MDENTLRLRVNAKIKLTNKDSTGQFNQPNPKKLKKIKTDIYSFL